MTYTKQTWATGDVITAEKLNHIENGITTGVVVVITEDDDGKLDHTWQEIDDLIKGGTPVFVKSSTVTNNILCPVVGTQHADESYVVKALSSDSACPISTYSCDSADYYPSLD